MPEDAARVIGACATQWSSDEAWRSRRCVLDRAIAGRSSVASADVVAHCSLEAICWVVYV
jgi:hypothetical protein